MVICCGLLLLSLDDQGIQLLHIMFSSIAIGTLERLRQQMIQLMRTSSSAKLINFKGDPHQPASIPLNLLCRHSVSRNDVLNFLGFRSCVALWYDAILHTSLRSRFVSSGGTTSCTEFLRPVKGWADVRILDLLSSTTPQKTLHLMFVPQRS